MTLYNQQLFESGCSSSTNGNPFGLGKMSLNPSNKDNGMQG